ncbi:MAG TPA: hypothetical protein PLP25_04415 [Candidatus Limiplasma sp.]|nr:hypothetical protein [Candidatus Limiplasma sp.]HPS81086.1 hypothetical protein [Candidatus Limiplasma sp.]
MQNAVLILDQDTALAGLIARTLRSQQVYCELAPFGIRKDAALQNAPCGIIIAARADPAPDLSAFDTALLSAGLPVLALGGMVPALCAHFGGATQTQEGPNESITLGLAEDPLFDGMSGGERVFHSFSDLSLPESLNCLATATERCIGFYDVPAKLYAVQYPIERNDPDAVQLLRNFACLICGVTPDWTEERIVEQAVDALRNIAGDGRVLCAVSGGVDSAVCAKLAHEAVGDRLTCVFVDTGLFRRDEPDEVIQNYLDTLGLPVVRVDARKAFLHALEGVTAVLEKERIVSSLLRQVYYKQLTEIPDARTLVLGTNYNDTLYGAQPAALLPEASGGAALRVTEPVRVLFKDEIRRIAKALSLPGSIAERQPFPASGLAVRIYGEVTEERLALLRAADAIFSEEVRAGGHERRLWQYYASLGENREGQEGYVAVLRACQACGGDACASRLPYDLLERVVERILHTLPQVTRVVYDMTPSQNYALME